MAWGRLSADRLDGWHQRRLLVPGLALLAVLVAAVSAHATFVGQNGKIAFFSTSSGGCVQLVNPDGTGHTQPGACDITGAALISPGGDRVLASVYDPVDDVFDKRNSKLDGSDAIVISGQFYEVPSLSWSPDGYLIGVTENFGPTACCTGNRLTATRSDGTGGGWPDWAYEADHEPSWSNDGRFAFTWHNYDSGHGLIATANSDGTNSSQVLNGSGCCGFPVWSLASDRIAFTTGSTLAVVNDDGTGLQTLATGLAFGRPQWSPDSQEILFIKSGGEIHSVNPDGTDEINLTNNPAVDRNPIWSPDSQKIAFESNRDGDYDIYVMNRDGTGLVNVTANSIADGLQDWQSIPINAYPRPKGATPVHASLVPAYTPCGSPNREHGPPLAFGSCSPPTQTSDELAVGTADSNGKPTRSVSSVKLKTLPGSPPNPPDEADVRLEATITDVYNQGTLDDYAGELRAQTTLRITDKLNTPHPGGPGAGTVTDISFGFTIPCAPVPDPNQGSSCTLDTTADALYPGAIAEGRRAIWQLGELQVYDGGADDDGDTPGDNTLFMRQGIFVP